MQMSRGISGCYLPQTLVKMRVGGESNRSLERVLLKSREDLRALRRNNLASSSAEERQLDNLPIELAWGWEDRLFDLQDQHTSTTGPWMPWFISQALRS